jgi:hypothetical protein
MTLKVEHKHHRQTPEEYRQRRSVVLSDTIKKIVAKHRQKGCSEGYRGNSLPVAAMSRTTEIQIGDQASSGRL